MRHRKGRSALTATGIVLGVAIFFGVLVSNASTATGFESLIEEFTGRADVLVAPAGAFAATAPASLTDRIAALPDVELAVPRYGFGTSVVFDWDGNTLNVTGVGLRGIDLPAERRVQRFELASGRLFADGEPEIVIGSGIEVPPDASAVVQTASGPRPVRVVGVLRAEGAGRLNDGLVVYTSISTARTLAGAGDVVDQVAVILSDGADVQDWIARHETDGLRTQDAGQLAAGFRDFLAQIGAFFALFGGVTLFVGAFLIYLTLSMSVVERTRVYGTLRALGATQRQVRRVVTAEALALGVVCTTAGLALGLAVARGLLLLVANMFRLELTSLTVRPGAVAASAAIGVATTVVASLLPARRAGRLPPVLAMKGDFASSTRLGRGWIAGLVCLALGGAAAAFGRPGAGALATIPILLGAVLAVPLLLRPLAALLGRVTGRLAAGVGDVAVLHLVKERSRSAYTLGLLMVVMAMLFAIGGINTSVRDLVARSIDRQFGADLSVDHDGPLDEAGQAALAATRGVATVSPLRYGRSRAHPSSGPPVDLFVTFIEPDTYFDAAGFLWVDGADAAARRALADGGAVVVPAGLARRLGVQRGGTIELDTQRGRRPFRVAGTVGGFDGEQVTIGAGDGRSLFGTGAPTDFRVEVADGADARRVARRIESEHADLGFRVRIAADAKEEATDELGRFFYVFYAILGVAAVIGLLGLANTLAVSVLQRYREIGILRAIGVTRPQVFRMVVVESMTMGLAAFALSVPLGGFLAWLGVSGVSDQFGLTLPYRYPSAWVPGVALLGIAVAALAAIGPGRRASRLHVVEALQYE